MMNLPSKRSCEAAFKNYPDILSVADLGRMLSVSTKTAYRLVQQGNIAYFKIGRNYKIPKVSVIEYLTLCD